MTLMLEQALVYPFQDYLIKNKIAFAKCKDEGDYVTIFRCDLSDAQKAETFALLQKYTTRKEIK